MCTQTKQNRKKPQVQRIGLLGFSISSNCSPFGVQFALKKIYYFFSFCFCEHVQETICKVAMHSASCILEKWTELGLSFGLCPFPVCTRQRFRSSQMGLCCFELCCNAGRHVGSPGAQALWEAELPSPLQADSAAGRSAGPCTFPCSCLCPVPRACT